MAGSWRDKFPDEATHEQLLAAFERMTLLELSAFLHAFEERFGVQAVQPVFVGDHPLDLAEPEIEEQTEFTVVLESYGDQKIPVIKAVRVITKLGMKEAKDFVDNLPRPVLEDAEKDVAEQAKAALEKAGGTVTLR